MVFTAALAILCLTSSIAGEGTQTRLQSTNSVRQPRVATQVPGSPGPHQQLVDAVSPHSRKPISLSAGFAVENRLAGRSDVAETSTSYFQGLPTAGQPVGSEQMNTLEYERRSRSNSEELNSLRSADETPLEADGIGKPEPREFPPVHFSSLKAYLLKNATSFFGKVHTNVSLSDELSTASSANVTLPDSISKLSGSVSLNESTLSPEVRVLSASERSLQKVLSSGSDSSGQATDVEKAAGETATYLEQPPPPGRSLVAANSTATLQELYRKQKNVNKNVVRELSKRFAMLFSLPRMKRLSTFPPYKARKEAIELAHMLRFSPKMFFYQASQRARPSQGTSLHNVSAKRLEKRNKKTPVFEVAKSLHKRRRFDVPQIECPPTSDGAERFSCPSPDRKGRYKCILDHGMCDGFIDCPNAEDEDRMSCMFYQTTKAHLDVLADALLRWARRRY